MSWGAERLRAWRDRLNPEASSSRIGAGFGAIAAGTMLAVLGVALVVLNDLALLTRPSWLRELGFVAAASGLPLFLAGISVTLPSSWIERGTVGTGSLLVAAGVIAFSVWYPHNWHLTVQAPNGYAIGGYLAGITLISAGTSSCLARHLVNSVRPVHKEAAEKEDGHEWTDEEIRADIRWAEDQGWNWGGVREDKVDVTLRLKEDVEPMEIKGNFGQKMLEEHGSTEEAVQAAHSLTNLRGVQPQRAEKDTLEDQVGDLKKLRARKRKQREKKRQSWSWRLRHPFKWIFGGS